MLGNFLKPALKFSLAVYACLNIAGCATPAAWRYAEEQANEPPTYRPISDVYFAALQAPDQLRLCVLATGDGTAESAPSTLSIDLRKLSAYLTERGMAIHNDTSLAYNSIAAGARLNAECEPVLRQTEELIPIRRIAVDETDLSVALSELAPDELTVFVLQQDEDNHFVIASSGQDFPGLSQEAFSAHRKDNARKTGYLLLPFAVAADVLLGVVYVLGGVAYGTLCLLGASCN